LSTFIRFQETFAVERAEREWGLVKAEVVKLDNYDDILELKGKLVFLLQPPDCKRLNMTWKDVYKYEYPKKAYYIFGRDKYVDRNNITGLSEWVKKNSGGLDMEIIGFGSAGKANKVNGVSYNIAHTLLMDMTRKHVNDSVRKTN